MKMRAEDFGGGAAFGRTNSARCLRTVAHSAAASAGHVEVMNFPAALTQLQQGARHVKFDVVRVRADGDGGLGFHRIGVELIFLSANQPFACVTDQRSSDIFTGRPMAAERSAAKMTSCERAASARLVSGISLPAARALKKASNW